MNQRQRTAPSRRRAGFTLVEIMVVIVILGVLATIVVPNVLGASAEAEISTAKTNIKALEDGVTQWLMRRSKQLPESLDQLAEEIDGKPAILADVPKDPWGNDFIIEPDPSGNRNKFVIYSWGPDGEEGTEDDIRSDTMNKSEEDK